MTGARRSHGQQAIALLGERAEASSDRWLTALGLIALDRPVIAAVINLTRDSFWPPSRAKTPEAALALADRALRDGADILDVGGESTRPGARAVRESEEIARVAPVVRELRRRFGHVPICVDTVKAGVARAALDEGAAAVNDVSGLRIDPDIATACAAAGAGLVLMHSRGTVETMASYETAAYEADPVAQVVTELDGALQRARLFGVPDAALVVDPGLGFSKRTEHSTAVLGQLSRLAALGRPIMVGPSRKRFIGALLGGLPAEDRLEGTLAACVLAWSRGARLFRVHDVRASRRALDLAAAVEPAP
jgi:dihydropteroate synthase